MPGCYIDHEIQALPDGALRDALCKVRTPEVAASDDACDPSMLLVPAALRDAQVCLEL